MEEMEKVTFDTLEAKAPSLLEGKEIDCKEMLELNWACKVLPKYCPEIDCQSMTDWVPDIRHAVVHRNKMTATAACRTIEEAAKLADTLGHVITGDKLHTIAREMDWCRTQMKNSDVKIEKEMPLDLKEAIVEHLSGVLATVKAGTKWRRVGGWILSDEVKSYTTEKKWWENPWSDTSYWGQDRNRNYISGSSSPMPSHLSDPQSNSWRSRNSAGSGSGKCQVYVPPNKRQGFWRK